MNNELTTKELVEALQSRVMPKEGRVVCPVCKGLTLTYQDDHLLPCGFCINGYISICEYCGEAKSPRHPHRCEGEKRARDERYFLRKIKLYEEAEKIDYYDYAGKFLIDETIVDGDDFEEHIYNTLDNAEEAPEFVWAQKPERHIAPNIIDIIVRAAEDGYEGMEDNLDLDSPLLKQAQNCIDKWTEEQGDSVYVYNEDTTKAVILTNLLERIGKTLKEED